MTTIRRLVLAVAVAVILATPAVADCVNYREYLHQSLHAVYPQYAIRGGDLADDVLVAAAYNHGLVRLAVHDGGPREVIDSLALPEGAQEVTVAGDLAFAVDYDGLLSVVSLGGPGAMVVLASLDLGGHVWNLEVAGTLLLAARDNHGLLVVDVADPAAPVLRDTLPLFDANDVIARDGVAFVAAASAGVVVVDLADPDDLAVLATVPLPNAWDISLDGDRLAVAQPHHGIQILDVGDPAAPVITGWVDVPADLVSLVGERLHAVWHNTFGIIELAPDGSSRVIGRLALDPNAYELMSLGAQAMVICGQNIEVYDIDPPISVSPTRLPLPVEPYDFAIADDLLVTSALDGVLRLYRLGPLGMPSPLSELPVSGTLRELELAGDWVFVGDEYQHGVIGVNIADPLHPEVVWSLDYGNFHRNLALDGDRLVVLCDGGGGLNVIDVSDPASPVPQGGVSVSGYDVAVAGDVAYVAGNFAGVVVVDLSDPAQPYIATSVQTAELPRAIGLAGDVMVTVDYNHGISTLDISDPLAPVVVGSALSPGGWQGNVVIVDDLAYVASRSMGLLIYDLADLVAPTLVAGTFGAGFRIQPHDGLIYTASLDTNILAFPGHCDTPVATQLAAFTAAWGPNGVALRWLVLSDDAPQRVRHESGRVLVHAPDAGGGYRALDDHPDVYTAAAATYSVEVCEQGFWRELGRRTLVRSAPPTALRIMEVAPNPCNPATSIRLRLTEADRLRCSVVDLRGRRVATLADGWLAAGDHVLRWNGRDGEGRELSAGTYLIEAATETAIRTARVSLIK